MGHLPSVWTTPMDGLIGSRFKERASASFALHGLLPSQVADWQAMRTALMRRLATAMRLQVDHSLPLDVEWTGTIRRSGYRIDKLSYQAAADRYVTACLYVPDGPGPFPAVLNVHGHHITGHLAENVQMRGHLLAQNGFVCLSVDAFGSGERSTVHGEFEPHGGPRGTLLNNLGETLIGIQIADNMRGVDLLCSLPFVDSERIGVTGASGGGNQTMYLAAFDQRIRAAVPVCSVGTFESYVMSHNCICETIPGGMDICEEGSILACVAPRALLLINGFYDDSACFSPAEMLRSYGSARTVYRCLGAEDSLDYRILPTPHSFSPDAMRLMLRFFQRHLLDGRGLDAPLNMEAKPMSLAEAMVYPQGQRPLKIKGILDYCQVLGKRVCRQAESWSDEERVQKLEQVLNCCPSRIVCEGHGDSEQGFERLVLMTDDQLPIPCLLKPSQSGHWHLMAAPYGKDQLAELPYVERILASGDGVLLFDLYASGELGTEYGNPTLWDYHNTARTCFWMGQTMLGEWVKNYHAVTDWLERTCHPQSLTVFGYKDAAVAALLNAALYGKAHRLVTLDMLPSLNWSDHNPGINDFTLALCVTDLLLYGDIPDYQRMAERRGWTTTNLMTRP